MSDLFLASVEGLIKDLQGRLGRVRRSLEILQHQDSSYAQDHRALIAAYDDALAALRRHRDEAANTHPAVLEDATGPLCPVCCRPSWPMSENGRLWRCSKPECMVSSFVLSDRLPDWEAAEALAPGQEIDHLGIPVKVAPPLHYDLGTHKVLSMAGVQKLLRESITGEAPGVDPLSSFDVIPPEDPSHG